MVGLATPEDPGRGAPRTAEVPGQAELEQLLLAELESLGVDPDHTASAAPHDGFVFDLAGEVYDLDGPGPEPAAGVKLTWTEVVIGDYNQDGLVGVGDLTPLGQRFFEWVQYDGDRESDGIAWWPAGDPDDLGGAGPVSPLPAGCGAFNWRLARVDGDHNGEIGLSDITAIATHWQERLDGYRVYHRGPADFEYELLPNRADAFSPMTVDRTSAGDVGVDNRCPVRYLFSDFDATEGIHEYIVAPYDATSDLEGPASVAVSIDTVTGQTISEGLMAVLEPSKTTGTGPLGIFFDGSCSISTDGPIVEYEWDFDGDGSIDLNTGAQSFAQHTYLQNARVDAVLTVTTQDGKSARDGVEICVLSAEGNEPPSIVCGFSDDGGDGKSSSNIGIVAIKGRVPLTVEFDASLSSDSDGQIVSYAWDFNGDGEIDEESPTPHASYTYTENATYVVTLRITDDQGGIALRHSQVVVTGEDGNYPPRAAISASAVSGAPPLDVTFDASSSFDLDGLIARHEWDFDGDGIYERDSGTTAVLSNAYGLSGVYNVWLRVTDDSGATAIARQLITVNTEPFAALTVSPADGVVPLEAQLDGSGSVDVDGVLVMHEWDFDGDGSFDQNTGTVATVRHTYYEVGYFDVALRVTDQYGASATATVSVSALEPEDNVLPDAVIAAYPAETTEDTAVLLDASLSTDTDGTIGRYEWDFDGDRIFDALTNDNPQVTHVYEDAGTYDAMVRVTDNLGGQSTATVTVKVWSQTGNEPPTATLVANPSGGAPPLQVNFDATGSFDPDGSIVQCDWDLDGDGVFEDDSGTTLTNVKVFTAKGMYYVMVRVTDNENATAKKIVPVCVGHPPVAEMIIPGYTDQFPPEPYSGEDPATVQFDAADSLDPDGLITEFCWDLNGDGNYELSTGLSPYLEVEYDLENWDYDLDTQTWYFRPVIHTPVHDVDVGPVNVNDGPVVLPATVRVKNAIGATDTAQLNVAVTDSFDEVEDNDNYAQANHLEGSGPAGEFQPNVPGGDSLTGMRDHVSAPYIAAKEELTAVRGNLGFGGYNDDDNDLYSFTLADGGRVTATLTFNHGFAGPDGGADLNLRLMDSDGLTPVCEAVSVTSDETAAFDFRDPGTYYVRCNRFLGNWANYTLDLTAEPLDYFPEDGSETSDNNTKATASDYTQVDAAHRSYALGRLGENGDTVDYYSFSLAPNAEMRARVSFRHAVGDLDLELRGPDGELLSWAQTVTDNEEIYYTWAGGAGTGYVKVIHNQGGPVNYLLRISNPAAAPDSMYVSKGEYDDTIRVTWKQGLLGADAQGYRVYVAGSADGPFDQVASKPCGAYDFDGPSGRYYLDFVPENHDQPWWFKAVAYFEGRSDSDYSNVDWGYTHALLAPVNVQATDGEYSDRVVITWEPPLSGPDPDVWDVAYLLGLSGGTLQWAWLADLPASTTEYTHYTGYHEGEPLETLLYRVRTVKEFYADSPESVNEGYRAVLSQPTDLDATDGDWLHQVLITWQYSGAVEPDGFRVWCQDEYSGDWKEIVDVSGGEARSYLHVTELPGHYSVRAYREGFGEGPLADGDYGFSTGLQPPEWIAAYPTGDSHIYLQWGWPGKGPKPQGYAIQITGPGDGFSKEEESRELETGIFAPGKWKVYVRSYRGWGWGKQYSAWPEQAIEVDL